MVRRAALLWIWSLLVPSAGQQGGGSQEEAAVEVDFETCTLEGGCTKGTATLTMDANWRWLHLAGEMDEAANCFVDNEWVEANCPDAKTCTEKCTLDGITAEGYESQYGVKKIPGGIRLNYVTKGEYSTNVGSRLFMLDGENYKMLKLKNKEFSITVDSSKLACGLNGAVYFVNMKEDGGKADGNAGAKYGTGYCDAQCPHDPKFMDGEANLEDWDAEKSTGKYGMCCPEMDIWEANALSTAYTAHPCDDLIATRCEGAACGDLKTEDRYKGRCDKDGCDFNSYRMGNESFYGPGMIVDSDKPVTVVTQFLTHDATDDGDLAQIRRFYVQDGKLIPNSVSTVTEERPDSITDQYCKSNKKSFDDPDDFTKKGGLKGMGKSMEGGMVFVMSLWDDILTDMGWLDTAFPLDKPKDAPGVKRGPCERDSGLPKELRKEHADATVDYTDFKFGEIGSTHPGLPKGDIRKKALNGAKEALAEATESLLAALTGGDDADADADNSTDEKLLRLDEAHRLPWALTDSRARVVPAAASVLAVAFAIVGLVSLWRRRATTSRRTPSTLYDRVLPQREDDQGLTA